jgi:multidrug efflux pump subunit AcrB
MPWITLLIFIKVMVKRSLGHYDDNYKKPVYAPEPESVRRSRYASGSKAERKMMDTEDGYARVGHNMRMMSQSLLLFIAFLVVLFVFLIWQNPQKFFPPEASPDAAHQTPLIPDF